MNQIERLGLLERLTDSVASFLAYVDRDLRYVYNNAQYARWFGLTLDQLSGRRVRDVVGADRWREVEDLYRRALDGESITTIDSFVGPDDRVGWGKVDFLPDVGEDGAIQGLFVLVSDVTDLKESERRLEEAQERLEERVRERTAAVEDREAHLRAITDAVPAGIAFFDPDESCVFSNRTLADWLSLDHRRILGSSARTMLPRDVPSGFLRTAAAGSPVTAEFHLSAESRTLEMQAVPKEERRREGFYLLAYDVTQRQMEQRHHRRVHLQLVETQRLESLGLLTRGLAHDFTNMVQAINGNLDMARRILEPDAEAHRFLDNAARTARQAGEFCSELLAYSGKTNAPKTAFMIEPACREILEVATAQLGAEASFHLDVPDDVPAINANATQVKQVLLNLLINAAQAGSGEAVRVTLRVRPRRLEEGLDAHPTALTPGDYLVCEVEDDGSGMDERTVERLFEPFFTTKSTGRGLGLAAVLGIVQGHRGGIRVESALGEGSTLSVYFPSLRESSALEEEEVTTPWRGHGAALVIDDDPQVLEVSAEALRRCGFDTLCAPGGADGVRLLEHHAGLQLVLLDLMMPEMDGEETFAEIRRLRPELPVIVHSGFPAQAEPLLRAPRTALLQKPWFPEELRRVVQELLG